MEYKMAGSRIQHDEAREKFLKFLDESAVDGTRGTDSAKFIPITPLREYLRTHISDLLESVSPPNDVQLLLHRAHNILESYSQIFAILLSINKGAYIFHFDQYDELTDRRLPFHNDKEFPLQENIFPQFQQAQHKFCAPALTHLLHRQFSPNCILPFSRDGPPIARGSSGVIHKIRVYPGYDFLCSGSNSQSCCPHTFRVLKEFTHEAEFVREKNAFTRLIKDGQSPAHIIEYLGSYEQDDVRYILLEYADIGTLDDYFRATPSPTSEKDIIHFFAGLFALIKGLCRVHQLEESFVGWHEDIKPANILVLSQPGKSEYECVLKLSDFGTSHFKEKDGGTPRSSSVSFARTYAPPEIFRNEDAFLQNSDLLVTQAVDIWALGCVFLEAMVYVIHGWSGLERFRNERLVATQALADFKDGNCFHDGRRRLGVVDYTLDQILEERRRSDNISLPLVFMVKDMLNESPAARPDCLSLYHRTHTCIKESKSKFQLHQLHQNGNSNFPPPLSQPPAPPGPPPNHPNEVPGSPYSHQLASYVPSTVTSSSNFAASPVPTNLDGSEWKFPQQSSPIFVPRSSHIVDPVQSDQFGNMAHNGGSPSEPISSMEDMFATISPMTPPPVQRAANSGTPRSKGKAKELETPLRWSVEESFAWKKDHKKKKSRAGFSRIFATDKNKYLDVEGKNHLTELKNRDHVIVADDSFSMKRHKGDVADMVGLLAWTLKDFDPDGIELRLAVADQDFNRKNSSDLVDLLTRSTFQATCNMSHCLGRIFEDYKDKIKQHARGFPLRPMNIYILTNGIWQHKCEVEEQIIDFVKFLEANRANRRQVGIQFIRFGEDEVGMDRLHTLDTLMQRGLVPRDIVDEEYWKGDFLKILLGSINPVFDNDDDVFVTNGNGVANANGNGNGSQYHKDIRI